MRLPPTVIAGLSLLLAIAAFAQEPPAIKLLETAEQGEGLAAKFPGDKGIARGISDYIAGMTDRYAIVEYERIFNPRQLSFVNLHP